MSPLVQNVGMLVFGIVLLYYGAAWLVRGAARLAGALGLTPIAIGLTVVAFGTSTPELVVSTLAALRGNADIAVGNVLGSNLANIGLILGLCAVVTPLEVQSRVVRREMPIMLLVALALVPLAWDGALGRLDAGLLLLAMAGYLVLSFRAVEHEPPAILDEYEQYVQISTQGKPPVQIRDLALVVFGCAFLVAGGYVMVEGAVAVAVALGVSQAVIGLTVVAVGTSLPELATSLVAVMRRESDIAVGNVIGSNIFNVAGILGLSAAITPVAMPRHFLTRELTVVIVLSLLLLPLLRTGWHLHRWEGALLLTSYGVAFFIIL